MGLLQQAHEWVQKGYEISYIVIDQLENDREEFEKSKGSKYETPRYTYTFSIHEGFENEVWYYSVDSLEEGYAKALSWLEENR